MKLLSTISPVCLELENSLATWPQNKQLTFPTLIAPGADAPAGG